MIGMAPRSLIEQAGEEAKIAQLTVPFESYGATAA
jgi:hypothetical protein